VKSLFKQFCEAPQDSDLKSEAQLKLTQAKSKLSQYLLKEKQIKMNFAIQKQQQMKKAQSSPVKQDSVSLTVATSTVSDTHPPCVFETTLRNI
jgi:hypothetical protein